MKKKRVAVMFGGNSTEYDVSLESAYAVLTHMNRGKYDIFPVGITREGKWYRYSGNFEKIRENTWCVDRENLALPVLHGKNGEDGTVQGLFTLADIPVVGCGTLASALCMDKDRVHIPAHAAGVSVPKSVSFGRSDSEKSACNSGGSGVLF